MSRRAPPVATEPRAGEPNDDTALAEALDVLLEPRPGAVLATEDALGASGWPEELARVVTERELPNALRELPGVRVLLLHHVPLPLLRAL